MKVCTEEKSAWITASRKEKQFTEMHDLGSRILRSTCTPRTQSHHPLGDSERKRIKFFRSIASDVSKTIASLQPQVLPSRKTIYLHASVCYSMAANTYLPDSERKLLAEKMKRVM